MYTCTNTCNTTYNCPCNVCHTWKKPCDRDKVKACSQFCKWRSQERKRRVRELR